MNQCDNVTGVTTRTVQDYLTRAKLYGQVIRCTFPSGKANEYLPYLSPHFEGTIWFCYDGRSEGVYGVEETSVNNAVVLSDPDVELLHERDSAFCGDSG